MSERGSRRAYPQLQRIANFPELVQTVQHATRKRVARTSRPTNVRCRHAQRGLHYALTLGPAREHRRGKVYNHPLTHSAANQLFRRTDHSVWINLSSRRRFNAGHLRKLKLVQKKNV